jgi:PAS domain S-box-containing protein
VESKLQAQPKLLCFSGESQGEFFPLHFHHDRILIGRGLDCDLQIKDSQISRRHALLERRNSKFFLQDLGSCNGTFVNEKWIQAVEIKTNDTLQFGNSVTLKLVHEESLQNNLETKIQYELVKRIEASEDRYQEIIENLHEMIFILDRSGRLSFVNKAWTKNLGFEEKLSLGRRFEDFFHEDHPQRKPFIPNDSIDIEKFHRKLCLKHNDGSERWFALSAVLKNNEWFVSSLDFSKQRNLELEKEKSIRAQEENNARRGEFLFNMSHEIRTPLNAILGMAALAMENSENQDQKKLLNTVCSNSELLLRVINDLLDFSKLEVGRLELKSVPFSLKNLLINIKETFQQQVL